MIAFRRFALRFYAPLFAAIVLFLVVILSPKLVPDESLLKLEAGVQIGILGIKVPLAPWLEYRWVVRGLLIFLVVVNLLFALSIDFSKYFPPLLRMDVYFDVRGIERTLNVFSEETKKDIMLAENWESLMSQYDEEIRVSLYGLWQRRGLQGTPTPEEFRREFLHAQGETTFKVERHGWLAYKIVQSDGLLEYELDVPKKPRRRFGGESHLRDTAANYLRPSLRELLRSPSVELRPEFKQVFSIEEGGVDAPFDHIVTGMTRVALLPFLSFSNTLFVWKAQNGRAVPVAYCVYH